VKRNIEIRETLKIDNIVEAINKYRERWKDHVDRILAEDKMGL
jgi:hypothetical protein